MANPVMVVHTQSTRGGEKLGRGCWVWCPGCDYQHRLTIVGEDGSRDRVIWDWNGSLTAPTFSPSLLVYGLHRCHSFIQDGKWVFLADCDHNLVNKTVDMVPLPNWLAGDDQEVIW